MTPATAADASGSEIPASAPRAWLALSLENRSHGGNDGYDDKPREHYSWDSTVERCKEVAVGDRLVLWNSKALLGASVIQDIVVGNDIKPLYRCPNPKCGKAKIRLPKNGVDGMCYKCNVAFPEQKTILTPVRTYRSRHDVGWVELDGALNRFQLRELTENPDSIHSLRPLRWEDFVASLPDPALLNALHLLERAAATIQGGHKTAVVRVRVGQAAFRANLIANLGPVCAMTGTAPGAALEAAHLYSFAASGEHYEKGGLLLRRDIHRLFDAGQLAVNPKTLTIDVAPETRKFPEYGRLHGQGLVVKVTAAHAKWLALHWQQFRSA